MIITLGETKTEFTNFIWLRKEPGRWNFLCRLYEVIASIARKGGVTLSAVYLPLVAFEKFTSGETSVIFFWGTKSLTFRFRQTYPYLVIEKGDEVEVEE